MKNRNWITLLAASPMLLIPLMVVLIAFIVIDAEKNRLESSLSYMEQNNIDMVKSTIQSKVDSIVDLADYRKKAIKEELHDRIQQRVEDAYQIATALYKRYSPSQSEQEVKTLIIEALRPLVWNNGESFIWILDFDGVFQLAPAYLRHLEGESIIDFKDATGREVIKEEIEITRSKGQGFLWDTFTRSSIGTDEQFEQLAFVKAVGFYNWYMGSAEFLDIATKKSDQRLLFEISQLNNAGGHDFFVIDTKGALLLSNTRPDLIGLTYDESKHKHLKQLYTRILSAINNPQQSAFIEYQWLNPEKGDLEQKVSYMKAVPDSDWVIGSGFYPKDIARALQPQIVESAKSNQKKLDWLLNMAFWGFVASILASVLLSFMVYRLLVGYRSEVDEKNHALLELNTQLEEKVLKRTRALADINDELEMLAHTDCLTGIDNRFSFMKIIEAEVRRSSRFNEPFSLVLFDVDNFKAINDQYGHDVGDRVLVELAKITKKLLREVDSVCRFGGEEFVIVLPKTDKMLAIETAKRLCKKIEEHPFNLVENVTISLGVGTYHAGESIDELIKRVDVALYQAKRSGKNQVCLAEEE